MFWGHAFYKHFVPTGRGTPWKILLENKTFVLQRMHREVFLAPLGQLHRSIPTVAGAQHVADATADGTPSLASASVTLSPHSQGADSNRLS
jgi:hypothetical protein